MPGKKQDDILVKHTPCSTIEKKNNKTKQGSARETFVDDITLSENAEMIFSVHRCNEDMSLTSLLFLDRLQSLVVFFFW